MAILNLVTFKYIDMEIGDHTDAQGNLSTNHIGGVLKCVFVGLVPPMYYVPLTGIRPLTLWFGVMGVELAIIGSF